METDGKTKNGSEQVIQKIKKKIKNKVLQGSKKRVEFFEK